MNEEKKHKQDTEGGSFSFSISRSFRNRFISLVVEQIRRFHIRIFEDSSSYVKTKRTSSTKSSKSVILYLKLYAGQINSILIFFTDLLASQELQTMALYFHEIINKCRELESELSRYSRNILQSNLEAAKQNVKLTEEELGQLLGFINNFPAMLLSQGDSRQSIIDTVTKIQTNVQDLLGHSKESGVIHAELLFVGDMKNILNTVRNLSRTVMEKQGMNMNAPPVQRSVSYGESYGNQEYRQSVSGIVDENEVSCSGNRQAYNTEESGNEDMANDRKFKNESNTSDDKIYTKMTESGPKSIRSKNPNVGKVRDAITDLTTNVNVRKVKDYISDLTTNVKRDGQVDDLSKFSSDNPKEEKRNFEAHQVSLSDMNLPKNVHEPMTQNKRIGDQCQPSLVYETGNSMSKEDVMKEPSQKGKRCLDAMHKEKCHHEKNVARTPSLYDEIVEAGEADFVMPERGKSDEGDAFTAGRSSESKYGDGEGNAEMQTVTSKWEKTNKELNKSELLKGQCDCRRSHEDTSNICNEDSKKQFHPEKIKTEQFLGKINDHCDIVVGHSKSIEDKEDGHSIKRNTKYHSEEGSHGKNPGGAKPLVETAYLGDLDDTPVVDLVELNMENYSKDDIPEEYCDRINTYRTSSYNNDLDNVSDVDLNELNMRYYSKDDIPEDYWERWNSPIDIGYTNDLDEYSDVDMCELNTQFYSKDDIPDEYCDRVIGLSDVCHFSEDDDVSDVDTDELNTLFYSPFDIPDEYCDRVQPTTDFSYINDLDDIPDVSLSTLNAQYYSKHDIPDEFCDRVQIPSDIIYSNDLDEKSGDTLSEFNTKFYSNYDIPEDYYDRIIDPRYAEYFHVFNEGSQYLPKRLDSVCLSRDEILKENPDGAKVFEDVGDLDMKLDENSSKQNINLLLDRSVTKKVSMGDTERTESGDKENETVERKDAHFHANSGNESIAVYNNGISDDDTDDLQTLNESYYSKYDIPEDYEDRREIQRQKQQTSLDFAKSVIEQIKSSSDGKIDNDCTAPFKSLVDIYSSVMEIRKILRSKVMDYETNNEDRDTKVNDTTEKQEPTIKQRLPSPTNAPCVCGDKLTDALDDKIRTDTTSGECSVSSSSGNSIGNIAYHMSEDPSCSSSKSTFFQADSDIFYSEVTVCNPVSSATSSDISSGNYIVRASSEFFFDDADYHATSEHLGEWNELELNEVRKRNRNKKSYTLFNSVSPQNSKSLRHISNSSFRISPRLSVSDSCLNRKTQEDVETQTYKENATRGFTMTKCKRISVCITTMLFLALTFLFCLTLFGMCFEWPPRYCMDLHKIIHFRHIGPPIF